MILLRISTSQIWHTSTLSEKLGIICKSFKDIRLSQRKLHFLFLIIKVHHKVLDLAHMSTLSNYQINMRHGIPHLPRAGHCVPCLLCYAK
jgi:hypothetical protein